MDFGGRFESTVESTETDRYSGKHMSVCDRVGFTNLGGTARF